MVKRPRDTTKGYARLAGESRQAWHTRLVKLLRERNHAGGRKPMDNVELMHEVARVLHVELDTEAKTDLAEARKLAKLGMVAAMRIAVSRMPPATPGGDSRRDVVDLLATLEREIG